MSETILYKTITFTQEQAIELELSLLARIGQLRERRANLQAGVANQTDKGLRALWLEKVQDTELDLVTAHEALQAINRAAITA